MCNKTVHVRFLVLDYISDQYKTQEIYDLLVSLYLSLIEYKIKNL